MTLILTGIGRPEDAAELCGMGAECVVVLSGTKEDCRAAAELLFENVRLEREQNETKT